ncbi:hypothetical protein [Microcystis aeruginosa]|uniref:hypothetical protein n=1 Tax=Microcystis aeruginosa TaxID=1126 RepID=UPI0019D69034|nr:hypothetical protein [Microcystis aeruginosa]
MAELQRNRAESANRLRELVLIETLKLEEIARDFQIQQEIARRERARIEIIRISYRFGQGNSEGYLSQLSDTIARRLKYGGNGLECDRS